MRYFILITTIIIGFLLIAPYLGIDPLGEIMFKDKITSTNISEHSYTTDSYTTDRPVKKDKLETSTINQKELANVEDLAQDNESGSESNSSLADIEELLQER